MKERRKTKIQRINELDSEAHSLIFEINVKAYDVENGENEIENKKLFAAGESRIKGQSKIEGEKSVWIESVKNETMIVEKIYKKK